MQTVQTPMGMAFLNEPFIKYEECVRQYVDICINQINHMCVQQDNRELWLDQINKLGIIKTYLGRYARVREAFDTYCRTYDYIFGTAKWVPTRPLLSSLEL
jgi:hypothetical protein